MALAPLNLIDEDKLQLAKMANTLRFLCADMVQRANSGHPGAPMGLADIATILSLYLKLDPANPSWLNRDRVIFSGGHASALVYSLLHVWGFEISKEDLMQFRQLDSKTPGHPEYKHTPGVEITTGPPGRRAAHAAAERSGFRFPGREPPRPAGPLPPVYCRSASYPRRGYRIWRREPPPPADGPATGRVLP